MSITDAAVAAVVRAAQNGSAEPGTEPGTDVVPMEVALTPGELRERGWFLALAQDWGRINFCAPFAAVRPRSCEDLAAAVAIARAHGMRIAVRGRSHGVSGQSLPLVAGGAAPNQNTLVVDMCEMRRVLAFGGASITVEAGASWRDVLRRTIPAGYAPPVMTNFFGISIGGLLSVGGFGGCTQWAGLVCDNVSALRLVDGRGRIVEASDAADATPEARLAFQTALGGLGQVGIIGTCTLPLERVSIVPSTEFVLMYGCWFSYLADMQRALDAHAHLFRYVHGSASEMRERDDDGNDDDDDDNEGNDDDGDDEPQQSTVEDDASAAGEGESCSGKPTGWYFTLVLHTAAGVTAARVLAQLDAHYSDHKPARRQRYASSPAAIIHAGVCRELEDEKRSGEMRTHHELLPAQVWTNLVVPYSAARERVAASSAAVATPASAAAGAAGLSSAVATPVDPDACSPADEAPPPSPAVHALYRWFSRAPHRMFSSVVVEVQKRSCFGQRHSRVVALPEHDGDFFLMLYVTSAVRGPSHRTASRVAAVEVDAVELAELFATSMTSPSTSAVPAAVPTSASASAAVPTTISAATAATQPSPDTPAAAATHLAPAASDTPATSAVPGPALSTRAAEIAGAQYLRLPSGAVVRRADLLAKRRLHAQLYALLRPLGAKCFPIGVPVGYDWSTHYSTEQRALLTAAREQFDPDRVFSARTF